MASSLAHTAVLLGRGGDVPGIESYDPIADEQSPVLSLSAGQSVYAIDASPVQDNFCAGTRSGLLYRSVWGDALEDMADAPMQQGAGILSVRLLDSRHIAVSDTAHRCLVWQQEVRRPRRLPTGDRTVCSVYGLRNGELVGLAIDGGLLVWRWPQVCLIQAVKTPPVPRVSALVQLAYWPEMEAFVWPACEGRVILWRPSEDRVQILPAHTGDLYAITVCDGRLLTVGRQDGRLRCWQADSLKLLVDCQAPGGVISASAWKTEKSRMLLVNDAGQAGLYELDSGQLRLVRRLNGCGYRVTVGPDAEAIRVAFQQQQDQKAEAIVMEIRDRVRSGECEGLDGLHAQLVECGYEAMSVALQAEEARDKNDLVSELRALKRLADLVIEGQEGSKAYLLRYATLLSSIWQLGHARRVYERILHVDPSDRECLERLPQLCESISVLQSQNTIIQAAMPLDTLINGAMMMEEAFAGRYLIKSLDPDGTSCVDISPYQMVQEYEHIRCAKPEVPLPCIRLEQPWWLSMTGAERISTLIFAHPDSGPLAGLQLGFQFLDAHIEKVLIPIVLFDAGLVGTEVSVEEHNDNVLVRLRRVQNAPLSDRWLSVVYEHAKEAISRLITAGQSNITPYAPLDGQDIGGLGVRTLWQT